MSNATKQLLAKALAAWAVEKFVQLELPFDCRDLCCVEESDLYSGAWEELGEDEMMVVHKMMYEEFDKLVVKNF